MMNRIIKILLLLLLPINAFATTYYVATNGNDSNNGTSLSTPFATWQKGFTETLAGDTLFIRGGVYYLSGLGAGISGPNSGTAENPICVFAYQPDWDLENKPILDCSGVIPQYATDFAAISFNGVQHIHLKGLTVRNLYQRFSGEYMPEAFSAVACANFTFENCTAQNISGRGFWYHSGHWNTWDGPGALFEYDTTRWINCDAFDLRDSLSVNPGNAADGWKCHTYQGCVYMLEGCRAWNYSDDGFDISGEGHRIFKNCWAMSSEKYASMDIEGNGFKCTGRNPAYSRFEYLTDTILVRYVNCLAAYCHGSGFANNLQVDGVNYINNNGLIINNTSYHNAVGFWDEGNANTRVPNSPTYKNNIAINSTHYEYGTYLYQVFICNPPIYNASHNNWIPDPNSAWPGWIYNPLYTVSNDDFVSIDSSQIHAARKKDGSLPDITFLKLAHGSDLIDGGTDVGLPYYGTSPDLGYSEYMPIIADHTVVDKYDEIPQFYIDEVKKMWLSYAGESHSLGLRVGMQLLENLDSKYAVSVLEGTFGATPEPYTASNLRVSRATWGDVDYDSGWQYYYGEEDWYGSTTAINRTKAGLDYYNTTGPEMAAFGFGWCWDPAETNMTAYLNATQGYIDYCATNDYNTTVFFTTGPVDWVCSEGETGYLKYLAYESIRDYVALDESRILFDYADILYYDADGSMNMQTWNGHEYPIITETNLLPLDEDYHISEAGALRLAKAMWWMLARIAGWDGVSTSSPPAVDSTATDILTFTLSEQTGAATINTTNHTVSIEVDYTADITNLTPTITLSYGATVIPASGVARDFTSAVPYTVTALDGETTQEWTVTVTQEEAPPEEVGDSLIVRFRGKIVKR